MQLPADAAARIRTACADALRELVQVDVAVEPVDEGAEPEFADGRAQLCGNLVPEVEALVWLSAPFALRLAALRLGVDKEALDERLEAGFESETVEAFSELALDLWSALGRVFDADAAAAKPEPVVTVPVQEPAAVADDWLRLQLRLSLEGTAGGWLELAAAPALVERGGESELTLRVVTSSPPESQSRQTLETAFEAPVGWVDPSTLSLEGLDAFANAVAILVGWDLGARSGIDLVETFARDARTRNIPLAMLLREPTRARVHAALRAGALDVLLEPLELAEIQRRIAAPAAKSVRTAQEEDREGE